MDRLTKMQIGILINLFSPALAILAFIQYCFLKNSKAVYHWIALLIIFIIFLIPINHLMISEYIYGVLAGLSISTIVLLIYANLNLMGYLNNNNNNNNKSINFYFYTLLALGIIIYPFHLLIITKTDPNSWGFSPIIFSLILSFIAIIYYCLFKKHFAGIILLIVLICFNLNLLNSVNLWNYLIDPFLFIYAIIFSITKIISLIKK